MSWKTLLEKFGLGKLLRTIYYKLDWRKPNPENLVAFLGENLRYIMELQTQGRVPVFNGTQDQRMLSILKWVHRELTYMTDMKRFGVAEKWQTVKETLDFKTGDCEDGAILIYCLARLSGISAYAVRIVAGDVQSGYKTAGHCWVEYYADVTLAKIPYTMDWCYWFDDTDFKDRIGYDNDQYKTQWFNITYM